MRETEPAASLVLVFMEPTIYNSTYAVPWAAAPGWAGRHPEHQKVKMPQVVQSSLHSPATAPGSIQPLGTS